jgi:hypothetical protein
MDWSRSEQSRVKEIPWLAKNCRPNKLRRHVLSAERKVTAAHRALAFGTKVDEQKESAQQPSFTLGKWSILDRLGWSTGPGSSTIEMLS